MDFDAYYDDTAKTVEVYRANSRNRITSFDARDDRAAKAALRKRGFKVKRTGDYPYGTTFHGAA